VKVPFILAVLVAACATGVTSRSSQASAVLTVRSILDGSVPVGSVVRVEGRCLGYGPPILAESPPRTRSDWQFATDSVAVYVSGPLPRECDPVHGSTRVDTIVVRIGVDTLRWQGQPPALRRYLERVH
jgi:hypothetical protein